MDIRNRPADGNVTISAGTHIDRDIFPWVAYALALVSQGKTMSPKEPEDPYTEEEAAQRALAAIRRSFTMPHKTMKDYVGKTPRAKAMARRRKAKGSPKAK